MERSITRNLMYNLLLQVVTLVLPLITVPYTSRILGADGIGIYSFTLSITQYFIIFGTLGLSMYGNRQIAYIRDDKVRMSKTFWSIFFLRTITSGIAILLYYIIFSKVAIYKEIYMIQMLNIIAATLDISWLYMGIEDFKKVVIRNLLVKIIGVGLIFTFVNSSRDLKLYVFINVLMLLIGNALMWAYLSSTVVKVKIKLKDISVHLVPSIKLFIPQIAIQIYAVLNKTMLGAFSNVEQLGYYEQADKIIQTVLGLVTALGIVMLPRMSNIFAKGDTKSMNNYLNSSLAWVAYISVPITIGVAGISYEFVPWFFGNSFESAKYIIIALAPILYLIAMSNVMGMQYLTPANRIKEFTVSVICGAVINVIINLILIPKIHAIGTCVATIMAEFSVTAVQCFCLRQEINIKQYLNLFAKYVFAAVIMFAVVRIIGMTMGIKIITTIVQSIIGAIVYIMILIMLREKNNEILLSYIFDKIRAIQIKNKII
ncbi:oligosaccharide flippase family protein [Clostridium sp. C2-6-12]|uniref:oligosaccharide flippase family protein n=1 Tax=Clostridium sp. C2-6-12 TaxID=2698832 RepID=UPI0013699217|nr:oligosaccharide flippase family protein [Clostridium sp. C2-6-12]